MRAHSTSPCLTPTVLEALERAFACFDANYRVDWLLVLNMKNEQGLVDSDQIFACGLVNGVALSLGVPVDVVAREVRLGDGTPLLPNPPASDRDRERVVVRAAACSDNLCREYGAPDQELWRKRSEYVALLGTAKALGIQIDRVLPEVDADIEAQVAAGTLPDDGELLALYRRSWILAEGRYLSEPEAYTPPKPVTLPSLASPQPSAAPVPRRRIVHTVGRAKSRT